MGNFMRIKLTTILLILGLSFLKTFGQSSIDKLRNDFTIDSLGCLGLRFSHIDTTKKILDTLTRKSITKIEIKNIDIYNKSVDTLVKLLGNANDTYRRDHSTKVGKYYMISTNQYFWYYLTNCGKDRHGKILVICAFNNLITKIDIIEK